MKTNKVGIPIIVVVVVLFLAVFFVLQQPVSFKEGLSEIQGLFLVHNISFEETINGTLVKEENGTITASPSKAEFQGLINDLSEFKKNLFAKPKPQTSDVQALIEYSDLLIESLKLQQKRKELLEAYTPLDAKIEDLSSACSNLNELKRIVEEAIKNNYKIIDLNEKSLAFQENYSGVNGVSEVLIELRDDLDKAMNDSDLLFLVEERCIVFYG